ncbi:MAG: serine/threonine protein kinase [Sandaracinaceae bacterium]|nr:MAG: serine/threonine protein kinase [Sandaracinaceae bacterium]
MGPHRCHAPGVSGVSGAITTEATSHLSKGTVIADRFEVVGVRGEGGMGAVYECVDRHIDRRVALKILTVEQGRAKERFIGEARAASRISSRHAAAVHDFGEDPVHGLYMVMELLSGHTLDEVLARHGRVTPSQACEIAADVAEALGAAHAAGVVHRDLKPSNIWMLDGGGVKVIDFGIARVLEDQPGGARLTADTTIVGTPAYISPEAVEGGREVGPGADLYALGVILFEMITSEPPFWDEAPMALCAMHLREPPPRLDARLQDERFEGELPAGLVDLVSALLEKDPGLRPASAYEVEAILRSMSTEDGPVRLGGVSVMGGARTIVTRRRPRLLLPALIVGGFVVAAIAIVGVVWALRAPPAPADVAQPETPEPPEPEVVPEETAVEVEPAAPPGVEIPSEVRVEIRTTPARATLRLDGEEVTSPIVLPRGSETMTLAIEARGHLPEERELIPDRDQALEIVLRRRPRARRDVTSKLRSWE